MAFDEEPRLLLPLCQTTPFTEKGKDASNYKPWGYLLRRCIYWHYDALCSFFFLWFGPANTPLPSHPYLLLLLLFGVKPVVNPLRNFLRPGINQSP